MYFVCLYCICLLEINISSSSMAWYSLSMLKVQLNMNQPLNESIAPAIPKGFFVRPWATWPMVLQHVVRLFRPRWSCTTHISADVQRITLNVPMVLQKTFGNCWGKTFYRPDPFLLANQQCLSNEGVLHAAWVYTQEHQKVGWLIHV